MTAGPGHILAFVIGLPIAVLLLANVFALLDERERAAPLVRLATTLCVILGVLLIVGREYLYPLLAALATVLTLHVVAFYVSRSAGLGVARYSDSPSQLPTLTDYAEEDNDDEHSSLTTEPTRPTTG